MIDHDYKIITREVAKTAFRAKHFIAELRNVYIIVDGKRCAAQYSQQEFFGKTQASAMIQASNALRNWLKSQELSIEKDMVQSS